MKAGTLFLALALLASGGTLSAQQSEILPATADDQALAGLKRLVLPASYGSRPLAYRRDNTRNIYFPPIYNQYVWNCNQAGSIWTMYTYEINTLRNLSSTLPENQYSPMAVYNLLNWGNGGFGVSYFDSWELVKANGIPGNADFLATDQNSQIWMNGYDKYYRGMKNRVDEVFAIEVGTPEGLLTLKHWLNDHLSGSQIGGLANFQIGSGNMIIPQIPLDKNLEEEGQYIVTKYGPDVGHCMTFAGWNDSVRYDVNGDGRFTNTIDINGDRVVDMRDWEIGAMLVVNSWGTGFGNAGKLWVMNRLLAEPPSHGGIWNNTVMVVKPKKTYDPLMTVKASIRYNHRNRIKIQVGVATDPNATLPEHTIDFPCFSFQGDTLPMQGFYGTNSDLIQIGLDITPLMNYFPENGQAKIFLEVIQKSGSATDAGRVEHFSVMDYSHSAKEYTCTESFVNIQPNNVTRLSVPVTTYLNRPVILNEELPEAQVGVEFRAQLEADGTTGPYKYADPESMFIETPLAHDPDFDFTAGTDVFPDPLITARVMDLPFQFPFYGKSYTQVTVLKDGGIVMGQNLVTYPYVIDTRLRLYQNAGIFPFLSTLYYKDQIDRATMESNPEEVIFRWRVAANRENTQTVEFAVAIRPDGKIRFLYGNMMVTPDIAWISGLSAGNTVDYFLLDHNRTGMVSDTGFALDRYNWPSWLSLGSNGDLKGTPAQPGLYVLPLKVTDWSGISSYREMTLKVTGTSSVADATLPYGLSLYPNPATGTVWLKGYPEKEGTLVFSVYNLTGQRVIRREFKVPAGEFIQPVAETESLPAGMYLYRTEGILSGSGKIIRQ